jgi:integrase/recombinase XerC
MPVFDAKNRYETWLQEQPLSHQTRRAYNSRVNNFLGFLGTHLDLYPSALIDKDIWDELLRDYIHYLQTLRLSLRSVNSYLTTLDSLSQFLGLGSCDIDRHGDLPPVPLALSRAERARVAATIAQYGKTRDRAILCLLFRCGLRISEAAALDLGCVKANHILVSRNGATRSIALDPETRAYMAAWIKERKSRYGITRGSALFISGRGQRITTTGIDYCIKQFASYAKCARLSARALRHSFIVGQLKAGSTPEDVRKLAGHAKVETTLRHLAPYLQ